MGVRFGWGSGTIWGLTALASLSLQELTFADAYAHPSAKGHVFHGCNGPVNVVEIDGTFFIENDEAEAKTAQALELASEVASELPSEVAPAASDVAPAPKPTPEPAVALDSPFCSVETSSTPAVYRKSYSAAASKPPVGPKPSAAGFKPRSFAASKFSADPKCFTPASQPEVANAPLEVSICIMSMHVRRCNVCMCT